MLSWPKHLYPNLYTVQWYGRDASFVSITDASGRR